ncbi:esterase-like activity of phytase family protein [Commensalibacter papalotli (ex Botero et al. 2024)]|uniref:Contains a phytase-like domain n=1 Tax=Commensalibacter papalotli (ex Botero et al. 2024) TaxID=2972766 RepID=A0ABN8WB86_9PROT|nr:esterase-like activity of phytase family protein [Commensalibacter papalotli (ex Botero et al. 2024)]CAI3941901.1 Uncharacterized conserved protein [Commensalibacter papalotli (ex Botero et al. 2024)]
MRLQYLNQADLPTDFTYDDYKVGGLSKIDYDPVTDTYFAQSDFGDDGKPTAVYSFKFTGLYNSDGSPQIEFEKNALDLSKINNIDSIRRDPKGDGFWVTTQETSPSIYHYHLDGSQTKLDTIPAEKSFKGSTFSPDGSYFVSMERNLIKDATGYTRITKFDKEGNVVAQYAYYTDRPSDIDATSNGILEILALNDKQLLVLEKGFGERQNALTDSSISHVRIYEINLNDAQNVLNISHLTSENTIPVLKKLIFNSIKPPINQSSNTKEIQFNNIEGMSLGPTLSDGRSSLILVSGNKNSETQEKTQFASFAIQPQYDSLQLHYLNQVGLPVDYIFTDPTSNLSYTIGGLSGIDYDPKTDTYIVESDHQSGRYPGASVGESVIYRIKLTGLTDVNSIPKVEFVSAQPLLNEKGQSIADAESIRLDPNGDGFWYTTEEKPSGIYHYHKDGSVSKIAVPNNIATRAQDNLSLEGSTFAPDGSYYVSMERNLTGDATGYSRITKYDANGNIVAQYAYYTDRPSTIDATSNGISEILSLDNNTLLVMERGDNTNQVGASQGAARSRVRIYKVSLVGAQNVLDIENINSTNTKTMEKIKIFDSQDPSIINKLNTNETKIDNLEGMTLGPKLPDGRQSLILVSDNNFNASQYKTQFISLVLDDGDACFLAGTFIRAQQGMVRVEDIVPGDLVYCLGHNNIWQLRQVTWVGKQTTTVVAYKHDDLAGYPVCIRRNAFEEGVPFADLYVTAEHCMVFDGCFVPVRLLVNGKTIFYDHSFKTYDYYHIELERHSIISANGALSESYLDTGNRHYFTSKALSNYALSNSKDWDRDAAAPLITKRGGAKAIFDYLNLRADKHFVQPVQGKKERTNNPNLYLITDDGNKIAPIKIGDKEALFELPSTVKNVRLVSRTYRPCDVYGPFSDNRYVHGVLVGNITRHQDYHKHIIDTHLSGGDLSGWLPQSQTHARWTSGNALIPLNSIESAKNTILSIQILETGSYLVE